MKCVAGTIKEGVAGTIKEGVAGTINEGVEGTIKESVAGTIKEGVAGAIKEGAAGTIKEGVAGTITKINIIHIIKIINISTGFENMSSSGRSEMGQIFQIKEMLRVLVSRKQEKIFSLKNSLYTIKS